MTQPESLEAPTDVRIIQEIGGRGMDRGLYSLAVADSLTDEVATRLLRFSGVADPVLGVSIIRRCDFVVGRNFEWRLTNPAKSYLNDVPSQDTALVAFSNQYLLDLSLPDQNPSRMALPNYLRSGSGRAYHLAALDAEQGLKEYARIADTAPLEVKWDASRLATRQQVRGELPKEALELSFLNGMVAYGEGRRSEAISILRPLATRADRTREVAIASHLVGRYDSQEGVRNAWPRGVRLLRKSLRIARELNDYQHTAQVSHTLGLSLLMRERARREQEALDLLRDSLSLATGLSDRFGAAQVLHTWAQALIRRGGREDLINAEAMLRESLEIGEEFGRRRHQARVLMSLSGVVRRRDPIEARRLRQAALELDPSAPDRDAASGKPRFRGSKRRNGK